MSAFLRTYWSVLIVAAIRLLFIVTFSPNVGGDSIVYYMMLIEGTSNLILAPGEPFLIGLPLRLLFDLDTLKMYTAEVLYAAVVLQHSVLIAAFFMFHWLLRDLFGARVAHVTMLVYGLHWGAMASASQINPESLQAAFLMVIACLLYRAWDGTAERARLAYFALAGFAFGWMFIVKYNSLYFLLLFVAAILLARAMPRRRKELAAVAASAMFMAMLWGFRIFVHKPSTGTYTLTHDKAWVLLFKAGYFCDLMPENGPNTKRLLLLNTLLPWDNQNVLGIPNVHYVSPQIHEYRQKYGYILSADDWILNELLARTPLRKDFNFFTAFSPTTYYLGLAEGDALGVRVFRECVTAYPDRLARNVATQFWGNLFALKTHDPFPVRLRGFTAEGSGWHRLDESTLKRNGTDPYSHPEGYYVWKPGMHVFAWLRQPYIVFPNWLVSAICFAGFIVAVIQRRGRADWIFLLACLLVVGFMLFSNVLLELRWYKELVAMMPLTMMIFAVSALRLIDLGTPVVRRID